jgi:hypothetical protein
MAHTVATRTQTVPRLDLEIVVQKHAELVDLAVAPSEQISETGGKKLMWHEVSDVENRGWSVLVWSTG